MNYTNVKKYTDKELLNRLRGLKSFKYMPKGWHLIAVRSKENNPLTFDDKLYVFYRNKCIGIITCTTNSGEYGGKFFRKWNKKGVAVIKSDEVYYDSFLKSDGKIIKHHNSKMQCLRQVAPLLYYRDGDDNGIIEEFGEVYNGNYSTNIHANSYLQKKGILSWFIGRWSVGCIVVNNLTKYYGLLMQIPYNKYVTLTVLKEF